MQVLDGYISRVLRAPYMCQAQKVQFGQSAYRKKSGWVVFLLDRNAGQADEEDEAPLYEEEEM